MLDEIMSGVFVFVVSVVALCWILFCAYGWLAVIGP
jgi:hypothetical protein